MTRNKITQKRSLMATTTLFGVVLTGAMAAGLAGTVATLLPTTAEAQDYTSGAVIGSVSDSSGKPVSGATVTLTSAAQGQTRTLTSSAAGSFSATGLAPGEYSITVSSAGFDDFTSTLTVVISQEVRIDASLQTAGAAQTVVVKGKRVRQDFAKTTTGLVVDLDTLVKQQPVGRSLTSVMMLAPTVVKGDSDFGDVASIGGASVAENAYYINGLNITNPDTYVSSAQVPFDFYKTIEVKTGGYAAEYGRATGGVINAVTKSGSNDFMFALHGNFAPSDLRAHNADTYSSRGDYKSASTASMTAEASGALIKDKLFAYGMYSTNNNTSSSAGRLSGVYSTYKATDPFYGLKLDGYITPTQHLELTYFSTKTTTTQTTYDYDDDGAGTIGDAIVNGKGYYETGGDNYVLKYTGAVTDWFTISAAYGVSKDADNFTPQNTTDNYVRQYVIGTGYVRTSTTQPFSSITKDETKREFYRLDGDMRFDWMGHHHVRFGVDDEELSMDKTSRYTGTNPMYYSILPDYGYFYIRYGTFGGNVSATNQSAYIQDSWDVTPKLNLQIGLRDDVFKQNNLSGEQYMDLKDNWGPRLGFSYDVRGDGSWRIYGNIGRYYIPPAMNLGYRGKDLYYLQYVDYDGELDATTGLPTSTGVADNSDDSCSSAADITGAAGIPAGINSTNSCVYYGDGSQEPANAKAAIGLKASSENEYILGTDYRINDLWSVGINLTYRNLDQVSEDTDFTDQINEWLVANGYSTSDYTSTNNYYVWNPGSSVTIRLKSALAGETEQKVITLTGLTFPKAKREYKALTLTFKRAFDGKWGLQGSYVWSRSHGNYEGTVLSDVGNDVQDDAGATVSYDYLGLTDYSTGLLPNHRAHTFKAYGSYALSSNFMVGANLLVQSPAHLSCEGSYPDSDNTAFYYGSISYYCNGEPSPRGTGLKTDWLKTVDLSLRYTVERSADKRGNLVLRADIFNLFNDKAVTGYYIQHEVDYTYTVDPNYGKVTSYTTPRYVRLGFDLTY
ncbi:MAG: TonB-dependent receptor [Asticcacaulis sp.]|uniref:TonB-dependent receptor n=1 Tax=Asticcacaulis sp. TaxID=1872648 RepID=UPI0039E3350F